MCCCATQVLVASRRIHVAGSVSRVCSRKAVARPFDTKRYTHRVGSTLTMRFLVSSCKQHQPATPVLCARVASFLVPPHRVTPALCSLTATLFPSRILASCFRPEMPVADTHFTTANTRRQGDCFRQGSRHRLLRAHLANEPKPTSHTTTSDHSVTRRRCCPSS